MTNFIDNTTIYDRLVIFIEETGMPLSELQQMTNLSYATIQRWMFSKLNLSDDILTKIDEFLEKYCY